MFDRFLKRPGGEKVIANIVGAFLQQSVEHVEQMRSAIAENDQESIRYVAHTLKSSSASVGAVQLSELCIQLESSARAGDLQDIANSLPELENLYDQTVASLNLYTKAAA